MYGMQYKKFYQQMYSTISSVFQYYCIVPDAVVGEADTITGRGSLLLPLVVRHTLTLPLFSFTVYVDEPKLIVTVKYITRTQFCQIEMSHQVRSKKRMECVLCLFSAVECVPYVSCLAQVRKYFVVCILVQVSKAQKFLCDIGDSRFIAANKAVVKTWLLMIPGQLNSSKYPLAPGKPSESWF